MNYQNIYIIEEATRRESFSPIFFLKLRWHTNITKKGTDHSIKKVKYVITRKPEVMPYNNYYKRLCRYTCYIPTLKNRGMAPILLNRNISVKITVFNYFISLRLIFSISYIIH